MMDITGYTQLTTPGDFTMINGNTNTRKNNKQVSKDKVS